MIAAKHLLHLARHGLLFSAAKFVVLAAPLLAAGLLSKTLYGTVEWWLSIASALGPILAFGAPGVIAYSTIRNEKSNDVRIAVQYSTGISAALASVACIFWLFDFELSDSNSALIALLCAVIVVQVALAARLKALGKGAWASLIEGTVYICLISAVMINYGGFDFTKSLISMLTFGWLILVFVIIWHNPSTFVTTSPEDELLKFFKVGVRFMVAGALMGLFMTMPRMALGILSGPNHVAAFALDFRWLSISIAAHQFINTVYFIKIFAATSDRQRDILQAITIYIVAFGNLCIIAFLQLIQKLDTGIPAPESLDQAWIFAIAMVLWSTTSCLEGNLQRHNANAAQIRSVLWGIVVVTTGSLVLSLAEYNNSIVAMSYIWTAGFLAIILAQLRAMKLLKRTTIRLRQATFVSIILLFSIGYIYIQPST